MSQNQDQVEIFVATYITISAFALLLAALLVGVALLFDKREERDGSLPERDGER